MFHIDNCYHVPHVRRHRPRLPHAPRLAHRLPRLRRPAGHAGDRGDPRSRRAGARSAAARRARAQLLPRRRHARTTARWCATGAHRAHLGRAAGVQRRSRRAGREVAAFNAASPHVKRGLAITPVKFGISFTTTFFNQAGALVLIYRDGSVQVNHGGTEMGQGLHTKIRQIAADALGAAARRDPRDADAHRQGAEHVGDRGVERLGSERRGGAATRARRCASGSPRSPPRMLRRARRPTIVFAGGRVHPRGRARARRAVRGDRRARPTCARVPLFATGYYRTPDIHFDWKTGQGKPFHYFAYGAAVSEVEVDGFTGQYRAAARRHPARRRRLAVAAGRSRPGRGRLRAGRRLAHDRGAGVGRRRRARCRTARRPTSCRRSASARPICASRSSSAPPSPASSTAARRWASRR